MAKRGKLKTYARVKGEGKICPKCFVPMQRRERVRPPANKSYFYKEWDYCLKCGSIYHYNEFKSEAWKEAERQENHFANI